MDVLATLLARSQAALFAALVLVITWLAKKVDDWRTSKFDDDRLIVDQGNVALGVRRAGLYLGGMIAMAGLLSGASRGLGVDLLGTLVFGVAAYLALFAARWLCHAVILAGIADDDECMKGNTAVGIVEGGIFLATGVVLNGALSGDELDLWRGLGAFAVFFVLGQIVFVALAFAYQWLTPFDDRAEIGGGNRAVALELAGMSVAIAIIIRSGLIGPSQGLQTDVPSFLFGAAFGITILFLFQFLLRWAFLHRADLTKCLCDGNLAVAITLQALTVAFALVIAAVVV